MKCPTCGGECEDAEPASLGSHKPLLQQLNEYERMMRFWDPVYKELAFKSEQGHNAPSLPPKQDSLNVTRLSEPRR